LVVSELLADERIVRDDSKKFKSVSQAEPGLPADEERSRVLGKSSLGERQVQEFPKTAAGIRLKP
jgi:hypothetical protein